MLEDRKDNRKKQREQRIKALGAYTVMKICKIRIQNTLISIV